MMVNRTKAAEAAVHHHDLCTLCSSTPADQTWHSLLLCFFFFFKSIAFIRPTLIYRDHRTILTYRCNSDVHIGLNDVSALQARDGAGVRPRVLLTVWSVKQKRSISPQEQVLVQLSLALPQVKGVSGSAVVSQDNCGLTG